MVRQLGNSTECSWFGGACSGYIGTDNIAFPCPAERCGSWVCAENYGAEIELGDPGGNERGLECLSASKYPISKRN